MRKGKFERLVSKGVILKPGAFSEGDKKRINSLTADEVKALISIRAKLGSRFIRQKATGRGPSIAIVF
jgi:hypothetical protein